MFQEETDSHLPMQQLSVGLRAPNFGVFPQTGPSVSSDILIVAVNVLRTTR